MRKDVYSKSRYAKRSYDYRLEYTHNINVHGSGPFLGVFKSPYFSMFGTMTHLSWDNVTDNASVSLSEDVASQLGKAWLDSIKSADTGELLKKYAIDKSISARKGIGHFTRASGYAYGSVTPRYNDQMNISLSFRGTYEDQKDDDYQHYTLDNPQAGTKSQFQNKYNSSFNRSYSGSVNLNVHCRLKNNHSIYVADELSVNRKESDKHLYMLQKLSDWDNAEKNPLGTLPSMEEMLMALDSYNSTVQSNTTVTHEPSVGYGLSTYNEKGCWSFLSVSLGLPMAREKISYWQGFQADTTLTRSTVFFHPSVDYQRSNSSKGMELRLGASMSTSAPSLLYMLDVRDTSNLKFRKINNPNLKNTTAYRLSGSYRNKFGRTMFNANAGFNLTQNAVADKRVVRMIDNFTVSTQENVNGNWSANAASGVDFPLCKGDKFRMKADVGYSFYNSVDLSGVDSSAVVRSVVRIHNTKGGLGVTYRPTDKLSFTGKGNVNWQSSTGSRAEFSRINAYSFDYGLTAQIELPWSMQLATDLTMYSRRGYDDDNMNTNELVWNARLVKRLMKGNLLIQLDGFDILGNLSNVYRSVSARGRVEVFYNVIPSYCLLHAIWRLNKQPKKKS